MFNKWKEVHILKWINSVNNIFFFDKLRIWKMKKKKFTTTFHTKLYSFLQLQPLHFIAEFSEHTDSYCVRTHELLPLCQVHMNHFLSSV